MNYFRVGNSNRELDVVRNAVELKVRRFAVKKLKRVFRQNERFTAHFPQLVYAHFAGTSAVIVRSFERDHFPAVRGRLLHPILDGFENAPAQRRPGFSGRHRDFHVRATIAAVACG